MCSNSVDFVIEKEVGNIFGNLCSTFCSNVTSLSGMPKSAFFGEMSLELSEHTGMDASAGEQNNTVYRSKTCEERIYLE